MFTEKNRFYKYELPVLFNRNVLPGGWGGGGDGYTSVILRILGNLYGVVCREDTTSPCSHVVTLVPVILRLHLHE